MVMRFLNRRSNISSTQHGKDEGLQERHKEFQRHHKQGEWNRGGCTGHWTTKAGTWFAQNKNKAHETQDHDVACSDVGKQTQEQGEGLEEQTKYFDWGQD